MRTISVLLALSLICCIDLSQGCGRGRRTRRGVSRDTTPPTITCPPDLDNEIADELQVNTKVEWVEPTANDDRDGNITPDRVGLPPGKLFSEGTTTITYSARDKSKNVGSCSFVITVKVLRCPFWGPQTDGWKWCHVSHDMRRGSTCRFGCYEGHELVGPEMTTCLDTEEWDTPTQPSCQKVQCDAIYPAADQQDKVNIDCTDGTNYRSICSYICGPGYSVLPGYTKLRICGATGNWLGRVPTCLDTSPPVFQNCPAIRVGYAERTKTSGRVYWPTLRAEDNTGTAWITHISGPASGAVLDVGDYNVSYMAYDAVNNTAFCDFKVVVKQIRCPTIHTLPYTHVTCPDGRIYGAGCDFTCDNKTSLNANSHAVCNSVGEGSIQYGQWTFGNDQPYCELTESCPALRAPDNGALACDVWLAGRFCKMFCQDGYAVARDDQIIHKQLLICGNSNDWINAPSIPDCMSRTPALWVIYSIGVDYYYTGDCSAATDEIKQKFLEVYTNAYVVCNAPECSPSNVQVTCGEQTDRKKRDLERDERDAGILTVSFEREATAETLAAGVIERKELQTNMAAAIANGTFNLQLGTETLTPTAVAVSLPQVKCSPGSVPDPTGLQCIECGPGYYHDASVARCEKCPHGSYQPDSGQTGCLPCPYGQTTQQTSSKVETACTTACEPGQYSADGTPPCSPCDVGTYSTIYGTTDCTSCPGSQTTLTAGSISESSCHEFDISFTALEDGETAVPATVQVAYANSQSSSSLTVEFWVKCSTCNDILAITNENGVVFAVQGEATVINSVTIGNIPYPLSASRWSRIKVTSNSTGTVVSVDNKVLYRSNVIVSLPAASNVTVGGGNFIGTVSQLGIWSNKTLDTASNSCFTGLPGDVLSWRSFEDSDGTFVKVQSTCDAFDNCASSPCQSHGNCTDRSGGYVCSCFDGYTGSSCETNINDCIDIPCDNNATCVDGVNNYTCLCAAGYKGDLCETKVVDGHWSSFEEFSLCSVTCGVGIKTRERVCSNPEPINGGKVCEGPNFETQPCTADFECVNNCGEVPTTIDNGSMNCSWVDPDTRVCYPYCKDGYDFDSEFLLSTSGSPIMCGLTTAYIWNIQNIDNPFAQLPSCTAKQMANEIISEGIAVYPDLDESAAPDVISQTEDHVNGVVSTTTPVSTGRVRYLGVTMADTSDIARRRRSTTSLTFTVKLSCVPVSTYQECYNLLEEVLTALQQAIDDLALTVTYNGQNYDVGINSTSYDGTTTCDPGSIPVYHYCVPCGPGSYQLGSYCDRCPLGSYQDVTGQTSCKLCSEGTTTLGLQSRTLQKCDVAVDITTDSEATLSVVIIGVSAAVGVISIVVIAVLVYKFCIKGHQNATDPYDDAGAGRVMVNYNTHYHFGRSSTTVSTSNVFTIVKNPRPRIDLEENYTSQDMFKRLPGVAFNDCERDHPSPVLTKVRPCDNEESCD